MNYSIQKLKEYLLGDLSETETEKFDELSFTDEGFDAALKAAENDLIDAYLNNDLSGADVKKFESVYFATRHRREKVEFARALQTVAKNEIGKTETKTGKTGFFADWNIFGSRARQFGFAAAILVLFFGIFWFAFLRNDTLRDEIAMQNSPTPQAVISANESVEPKKDSANNENASPEIHNQTNRKPENVNEKTNREITNANKKSAESNQKTDDKNNLPKPENNSPKPIIATFSLAPPLRGVNKIPLFNIPKNASQIGVKLQLDENDFENYHVTLTNETGDINLWRRGSLSAKKKGDAKFLNVTFPAKLLSNGFYSLTVSGVNKAGEAEIIANYPFRVSENR